MAEIPFPKRGESQNDAYRDQIPLTTRAGPNCRALDSVTGRSRGAQRPGSKKYLGVQLGTEAIRRIDGVALDRDGIIYETATAPEVRWGKTVPTKNNAVAGAIDRAGNLWVLDGRSSVARFNPEGRQALKIELPVEDNKHLCRALEVSPFAEVYVATSEFGANSKAKLWGYKIKNLVNGSTVAEQLFELSVDELVLFGHTERLRLSKDSTTLYALQNNHEEKKSWVVQYQSIETTAPVFVSATVVPYPGHDLVVKDDGSFVMCAPPDPTRGQDPRAAANTTHSFEDWTPEADLDQYEERKWCELDARTYVEDNPTAEDGDQIERLRDASGSGRDAFGDAIAMQFGQFNPLLSKSALAGQPGVHFDGSQMAFRSGANGSSSRFALDTQKTWLPSAAECMVGFVMAIRVPHGATRYEIMNRTTETFSVADHRNTRLWANVVSSTAVPPAVSAGDMFLGFPIHNNVGAKVAVGPFDDELDFALVSYVAPNGQQWDVFDQGFAQRGHWRVNGEPIEVFDSFDPGKGWEKALLAMSMGVVTSGAAVDFQGQMLRFFALRNYVSDKQRAIGCIHIPATIPLNTDSVIIDDGVNASVEFRWYTGAPPADTTTLRHVLVAANATLCAANFIAVVNLAPTFNITAVNSTTHPAGAASYGPKILLTNSQPGKAGHKPMVFTGAWEDQLRTFGMTAERVCECPEYPDIAYSASAMPTEIEKLEGWVAWWFGSSHKLPDSSALFPHPYHLDQGFPTGSNSEQRLKILHTGSIVAKYSAAGEVRWIVTDEDDGADVGGLGYGLEKASDGSIYSVGPHKGADTVTARRITDQGDMFSLLTADGAWAGTIDDGIGGVQELRYQYPRCAVDKFDNLYIPRDTPTQTVGSPTKDQNALVVFQFLGAAGLGVIELDYGFPDPGGGKEPQRGRMVLVDKFIPDFKDDSITRAEYVYLLSENQGGMRGVGAIQMTAVGIVGDYVTIDDGINPPITYEWVTFGPTGPVTIPGAYPVAAVGGGATAISTALALWVAIDNQHSFLFNSRIQPNQDYTYVSPVDGDDNLTLEHELGGGQYNIPIVASFATPGDIVFSGMTGGSSEGELATVHRVRLVKGAGSSIPQRERFLVSFSEGKLRMFDGSTGVLVTGSEDTYEIGARFVSSASLFGELFIFDGSQRSAKVWKSPTPALPQGEVVNLIPTTAGAPPARSNLATAWAGRLVVARGHGYFMSERGNPYGWDFFPTSPTADSAILGDDVEITGPAPDLIVGLYARNDDTLIVLGDSSTHVIRGNPRLGGQMHLIQKKEGGIYGEAHSEDPDGLFYYMGSNGGIHVLNPDSSYGGRITRDNIERQLQDIDHSTYRVEMVWDYRNEGLIVALVPWVEGPHATAIQGWFFDKKNGGWWPWSNTVAGSQPTAFYEHDGDEAADRVILLGGGDGYMRQVDGTAADDDGEAIASSCLLGPIVNPNGALEVEMDSLIVVLGEGAHAIKYKVWASDTAEDLGEVITEGEFIAGRNEVHPARAVGAAIWIELFNNAINERWAIETITAEIHNGGPVRSYQ